MKYLFIVLILFFVGCGTTTELENQSVDDLFKTGLNQYKEKNYLDAIETFKEIILRFPASTIADDAQYYLAESRFFRQEYMLAANEYDFLIRTMPSSTYLDASRYRKAQSYFELSPGSALDQKYSSLAIDEFQNFLETTRNEKLKNEAEEKIILLNDKLAYKIYESSLIYYRMHYYRSSITYCDLLVEKYPDSKYIEQSLLIKAKSYFEREISKPKEVKKDFSKVFKTIEDLKEKSISEETKTETDFILYSIQEMQKSS